MDPAQFIQSGPAALRYQVTVGSTTVNGLAGSISLDYVNTIYGQQSGYTRSVWLRSRDLTADPVPQTRITLGGVQYLILGIFKYAAMNAQDQTDRLLRLDLGEQYAQGA